MNLDHLVANADTSLPVIYKQGIILFLNLLSLLRVLPSWKFYKRLKRKVGRNGHLGIQLRVRRMDTDRSMDLVSHSFSKRLFHCSPLRRFVLISTFYSQMNDFP